MRNNTNVFGHIFLLWITLSLEGYGLPDDCDLDCTLKPHLPCMIREYRYPRPPDDSAAVWPSRPKDADVVYNDSCAQLLIAWRLPEDRKDSFTALTGFEIQIHRLDELNNSTWIVFDLSNATWKVQDKRDDLVFQFNCLYGLINKYKISVTSLPKAKLPATTETYLRIPVIKEADRQKPRRWKTYVAVTLKPWLRRIDVMFGLGPPEFDFVQYDIFIKKYRGGILRTQTADSPTHRIAFTNVAFGQKLYYIEVKPVNTDRHKETCRCKEDLSDKACEFDHCVSSYSPTFNFTEPMKTTTTSIFTTSVVTTPSITSTKDTSAPTITNVWDVSTPTVFTESTPPHALKTVGIALGVSFSCIMLVISIGLTVLYVRRRTHSTGQFKRDGLSPKPRDPETYPASNGTAHLTERKITVLLVYHPDNDNHIEVVKSFGRFLHNEWHCYVRLDLWCQQEIDPDKVNWLLNEIENADKIVIINSEGAFNKYRQSQQDTGDAVICENLPFGDLFTPAIKTIMHSQYNKDMNKSNFRDKSIMVYFDYTPEEKLLKYLCTGLTYKLMKQLEQFLFRIYGWEQEGPSKSQYLPGSKEENYWQSPDGNHLFDVIKKARKFHKMENTAEKTDEKSKTLNKSKIIPLETQNNTINRLTESWHDSALGPSQCSSSNEQSPLVLTPDHSSDFDENELIDMINIRNQNYDRENCRDHPKEPERTLPNFTKVFVPHYDLSEA